MKVYIVLPSTQWRFHTMVYENDNVYFKLKIMGKDSIFAATANSVQDTAMNLYVNQIKRIETCPPACLSDVLNAP